MTWRDRYRRASFRGVPFYVEGSSAAGGRRTAVHELLGTDARVIEDLGRATESISLRAYVLGDDFDLERDELLAACRRAGPGELVHPTLGTLSVRCLEFRVEDREREGGFTTILLRFLESGIDEAGLFRLADDAEARAAGAADGVLDEAEAAFVRNLVTEGQPDHVLAGAAREFERFGRFLDRLTLDGPLERVARFRRTAARLADRVLERIAQPHRQAALVRRALSELRGAVNSRRVLLGIYVDLGRREVVLEGGSSFYVRRSDRNTQAAFDLFASVALAEAVRTAAEIAWAHRQEAEAARARILAAIDRLRDTADDETYLALAGLAEALGRAVPPPGADLPELERYDVLATRPALAIAHELYGDRGRELELVERNRPTIRHPGRVAGGSVLEVLSA